LNLCLDSPLIPTPWFAWQATLSTPEWRSAPSSASKLGGNPLHPIGSVFRYPWKVQQRKTTPTGWGDKVSTLCKKEAQKIVVSGFFDLLIESE
jgi:hypothetical protein